MSDEDLLCPNCKQDNVDILDGERFTYIMCNNDDCKLIVKKFSPIESIKRE